MVDRKTRINLMGAPIDLGVSKLGVDMGPTALRYAGIMDALLYSGFECRDCGDLDVRTNFSLDVLPKDERQDAKRKEIIRAAEQLAAFTHECCKKGSFPLTLGGDHSTTIGALAGVAKAHDSLGVLWIDAHPDSNTPETSPSGNIHGMPLAISLGHGYPDLVNCFGFAPKVKPENVCIVGAKDIDPGERAFLKKHGVSMFTTFDIQNMGMARVMEQAAEIVGSGTNGVYVSFDTDAIDKDVAPGTGIVTKGGLSYREITFVAQFIGANIKLAGLDLIEVNPLCDVRNITAELSVELAMSMLGASYSDYEKIYLAANTPE
mgnify:CR=1 FL=1